MNKIVHMQTPEQSEHTVEVEWQLMISMIINGSDLSQRCLNFVAVQNVLNEPVAMYEQKLTHKTYAGDMRRVFLNVGSNSSLFCCAGHVHSVSHGVIHIYVCCV